MKGREGMCAKVKVSLTVTAAMCLMVTAFASTPTFHISSTGANASPAATVKQVLAYTFTRGLANEGVNGSVTGVFTSTIGTLKPEAQEPAVFLKNVLSNLHNKDASVPFLVLSAEHPEGAAYTGTPDIQRIFTQDLLEKLAVQETLNALGKTDFDGKTLAAFTDAFNGDPLAISTAWDAVSNIFQKMQTMDVVSADAYNRVVEYVHAFNENPTTRFMDSALLQERLPKAATGSGTIKLAESHNATFK